VTARGHHCLGGRRPLAVQHRQHQRRPTVEAPRLRGAIDTAGRLSASPLGV